MKMKRMIMTMKLRWMSFVQVQVNENGVVIYDEEESNKNKIVYAPISANDFSI